MKSCMGKILRVNLTTGEITTEQIPEAVYDAVLSGKGLGAWYLYKNIPAGADPLGPENILGFVSGALTGTGAFFCGRWMVVCKSPLTGGWGDANCGGVFSPAIKQCGFDGIFFSGISEKPVYLYCDNQKAELRDASAYWGLDATEAEEKLNTDACVKKRPCVAVIGQAGENCSLISGICNEGGRIAARSGVGAVMGSKRLKAVVLAGSKPIPCSDRDAVHKLSRQLGKKLLKVALPSRLGGLLGLGGALFGRMPLMPLDGSLLAYLYKEWGTPFNITVAITSGDGPIQNWKGGPKDAKGLVRAYNPEKIKQIETQKYHCYACPLGCGGLLDIRKNAYGDFPKTHKPEYETIEAFGPLCLNGDLDSVLYINELLNRAGMDSISAGHTISWAIECYEKGIITSGQTDGLELTWGNAAAIITLVKKMISREGFGDKLADGVKRASAYFGGEEFAMHIGGQEPGMHDSRNDPQLAIHYAADPAPGKHSAGMSLQYNSMSLCDICSWAPPATLHKKSDDLIPSDTLAMIAKASACYFMVVDGAGGCYYAETLGVHMWRLVEYLNAAEGWNHDGDHYMEIGARIQTLRQMFNIKHGIAPASFVLPPRMEGKPPLTNGPLKGVQLRNKEQVSLHWKAFGWDTETGEPLPETIDALGILKLLKTDYIKSSTK